jgi:hypothetical protein
MTDHLAALKPEDLAKFYGRIADGVDSNKGSLKVSLAALLMRQWLKNRDPKYLYEFDAPDHLKDRAEVLDTLTFQRRVLLTQEKARFTGGVTKWAGVVPRIVGIKPFQKWDTTAPLSMEYESLVEMPLRYQLTGDDADRDILYGLRGFQLKSSVVLSAAGTAANGNLKLVFQTYNAQAADRYDWNYSEHITVPNPDFGSNSKDAVAPKEKKLVVYHKHAKRLEDAQLAAPYDLRTKPWAVDLKFRQPAEVPTTMPK